VPASTDDMMDIFVWLASCALLLLASIMVLFNQIYILLENLMLKNDCCFGCLNSGLIEIPFGGTYPNPGDTDVKLSVYYILLIC
jgi:hypothetical protein